MIKWPRRDGEGTNKVGWLRHEEIKPLCRVEKEEGKDRWRSELRQMRGWISVDKGVSGQIGNGKKRGVMMLEEGG